MSIQTVIVAADQRDTAQQAVEKVVCSRNVTESQENRSESERERCSLFQQPARSAVPFSSGSIVVL
jgi:hypothetical protein